MNTLIQLAIGYASAALTFGIVAVVASGIDVPAGASAVSAGQAAAAKAKASFDASPFIEVQRQREALLSTQQHLRQMDRIRSRSW
ncbi:MAG TPA: hypothetical protein VGB55_05925 [Tepidisphaeraceae bacterium]|jgi:hypothetical protein